MHAVGVFNALEGASEPASWWICWLLSVCCRLLTANWRCKLLVAYLFTLPLPSWLHLLDPLNARPPQGKLGQTWSWQRGAGMIGIPPKVNCRVKLHADRSDV